MVLNTFIQWCGQNIIIPGLAIINDTNTTPEPFGPTCHLASAPPPGSRFLEYVNDHWVVAIFVTIGILILVGVILGTLTVRRRRILEEQLEMGYIDQEQFERLK
jgi:hypothetical protein